MMAGRPTIRVRNLQHTLRALSVIDPEQVKAFRQAFADASRPIIDKTKAIVPEQPMSGWGRWDGARDWDQTAVRKGLRTQISLQKRRASLRLVSMNAAGAIYENAGSKTPDAPFNRGLVRSRQGGPPRLLVKTWKQEKGVRQVYRVLNQQIRAAEERVQKAMR